MIKYKTFEFNPFDKNSIEEGKSLIIKNARAMAPSYTIFMKAAEKATGLKERSIKKLLYKKELE